MNILKAYPKLLLFACSCVAAYAVAKTGAFVWVEDHLNGNGSFTAFLAGLLFSFGFATPFSIGLLAATAPNVHPVQGALLGGAGALLSDLLLFSFARVSLQSELHRLSLTTVWQRTVGLLHRERYPAVVRRMAAMVTAGLIIASPLPDEIGVTMLGSVTRVDARSFAVLSYVLNTLGIFVVLRLAAL